MSLKRLHVEKSGLRHLFDALELVERMGCEDCDAAELWCSDWMRYEIRTTRSMTCLAEIATSCLSSSPHLQSHNADSNANEGTKAQNAKRTLSRMKSIAKVLAALSNSVEEAIQLVSSQSLLSIRGVGVSSLPDDLLAHIFELCIDRDAYDHVQYWEYNSKNSVSRQLASVCRRFRRITLHMPSLWKDVCNIINNKEWILVLKERCLNPVVHVTYCSEEKPVDEVDEFFGLLHPTNQWRGLDVECPENDLKEVLHLVSTRSGGKFSRMESLIIRSKLKDRRPGEDEEGDEGEGDPPIPDGNFVESNADLISNWSLPSLKELKIENFIPTIPWSVNSPALRRCELKLSKYCAPQTWDLDALKEFLRAVRLVESLSLTFINADYYTSIRSNASVESQDPIRFPNLKSLAIEIGLQTNPELVKDVMDAIHADTLHSLSVTLRDTDDRQECKSFNCLSGIFSTSTHLGSPRQMLETVKTFALHLDTRHQASWPIFEMLSAVPRLQNLWLDLPSWYPLNMARIIGWGEMRTIRIENQPPYMGVSLLESAFRCQGEKTMEKITRVELSGFGMLSNDVDRLKERLGEKLETGWTNYGSMRWSASGSL